VSGEALARRLLRLDAAYCAAAGLILVALFLPLSRLFHVPAAIPLAAGLATVGWALVVRRLARVPAWRATVARIAAANAFAALALVALAALSPGLVSRLLLAAVAIEVAAFAGGQVAALSR
jgi:hypothetical protein